MNCMKEIYGVVLCLFLLASCNGKSQKNSLAINVIDWESKTEAVTPQAVPLPTLCNIEYMQMGDSDYGKSGWWAKEQSIQNMEQ